MPIQQATDYGFRAVLHLSLRPGETVETRQIACEEAIPLPFLVKILRLLSRAGLVEAKRGHSGGYRLSRDPREITLLDVVGAVEGTHKLNFCLDNPGHCSKRWATICPIHRKLGALQDYLEAELGSSTFADLAEDARRSVQAPVHQPERE